MSLAGTSSESTRGRLRAGGLESRAGTLLWILGGAILLRVISGVGFANYDTLYALVWGQQLARGETPQYGILVAPTPHPLVEALGVVLAPLGPHAATQIVVALGFLALAACGWAVYRLGALWFNRPAGAVAAALLVTRVPILSYGVRAYIDVPYLLLVLGALIVETRQRRAGAPVLVLLGVAGLLRPEAWAFAGLYWLYLALPYARARARARGRRIWNTKSLAPPRARRGRSRNAPDNAEIRSTPREPPQDRTSAGTSAPCAGPPAAPPRGSPQDRTSAGTGAPRTPHQLAGLALLVVAAPLAWILSDWLVTGHPLWSLTNTRHTAEQLHRETGIVKVPEYIPRRIGEILGAAALGVAALGGVLSLLWLRARALPGALAGGVAVGVFAAFATVGLPINTRYAFLAGAILCVFAGAAVCGWHELPRGDPHRRWWMLAAAASVLALLASIPTQYHANHRELDKLVRQRQIQDELVALVRAGAVTTRCEPIGVPNHAPVPLLALWLKTPPSEIANLQSRTIARGSYVAPANAEVQRDYILDRNDPNRPVQVPAGFTLTHTNSSWRIYQRCGRSQGGAG